MAFQFKRSEPVVRAVQQIAREQVDRMIAEVDAAAGREHATVHTVRKRCKKLRGLIRLVRPQFKGSKTYEQENASYRDAASLLSFMRDAQSIIESYDALLKHYPDAADPAQFQSIRERLVGRREAAAQDDSNLNERIGEFRDQMSTARERIGRWKFRAAGFAMLEEGLEKTYSRGRRSMKQAFARPSTESFHEWRKHIKYHWYHCRLLQGIWKDSMKTRGAAARELSELLGDDHDLAMLAATLMSESIAEPNTGGSSIHALIQQRRTELQTQARALGSRMYAEKPAAFTDRMHAYWKAWKQDQAARKAKPRLKVLAGE